MPNAAANPARIPPAPLRPSDSMIDALPDLILQLGRDGSIVSQAGGRRLNEFLHDGDNFADGTSWPVALTSLLRQLTRKAIASRCSAEGVFANEGRRYEIRVSAQSPDRAVGLIRPLSVDANEERSANPASDSSDNTDRRKFWQRLAESISMALIAERTIALAVIHLDGIEEISKFLDANVTDQLIGVAMRRLCLIESLAAERDAWYVGMTADDELAVVVRHADRDTVERFLSLISQSLRAQLNFGTASFHLKVYAGVAFLQQDAGSQAALIDSARAATNEARRCEASAPCFFSDTLKLRALTRLDIGRELRDALAGGDITLRYRPRHDLQSGRMLALLGHVHWVHPIRGEIRPAEFLGVAAATGQASALSRSMMQRLFRDASRILPADRSDVRLSFAALRHHVLDGTLATDVEGALNEGTIDPSRLELRISERVHATRDAAEWRQLADRGVRIVVDEVGRKFSSIEKLASSPIWGMQLDRACAATATRDPTAEKVCRAIASIARALEVTPIATAVDSPAQRRALLSMGYEQGSGDYYRASSADDRVDTSRHE